MMSPMIDTAGGACVEKVSDVDGWRLHDFGSVDSTNLVAASLPPWEAVRAVTQSAGRGRFQRRWVSDEGGLWLSAVVPVMPEAGGTRALPLAIGWAVCGALQSLGVSGLRMRWPNDILCRDRKLSGLLIDRFTPERAVAGIGINVRNQPEQWDASLRGQTIRLADIIPNVELDNLTRQLLGRVRAAANLLNAAGFAPLLNDINGLWGGPREVELDLDGALRRGTFCGIDEDGRLLLADEPGTRTAFDASHVRHLSEI